MTTLSKETEDTRKPVSLEQIDEYDDIMSDVASTLAKVNGSTKATDDTRRTEVHAVGIRNTLLALREQTLLYEFYKARLG